MLAAAIYRTLAGSVRQNFFFFFFFVNYIGRQAITLILEVREGLSGVTKLLLDCQGCGNSEESPGGSAL